METPTHTASPITRNDLLAHIRGFVESLTDAKVETRSTYERSLREFVRWFDLDGRFLFAVDDVYRYRHYLVKTKELAPASVVAYLATLRQFCGYLLEHGVISYNPARRVRSYARRQPRGLVYLRKEEVNRLLEAVDQHDRRGPRDRALLLLMVHHGLTEVELVHADVGDFVFVDGMGALKLRNGDKMGQVLLNQPTAALIHDYVKSRGQADTRQPLFLSDGNRTRGMRMTTRGIRERVNYYFRVSGIKGTESEITPHVLRHTAAMLMAGAGLPAEEIKYRMRLGRLVTAMKYVSRVNSSTAP